MATATQTPPTPSAASARPRRYSALDIVTIIALGLAAFDYLGSDLASNHPIPPLLIMGSLWAIAVVVVATGWRWSSIPALLVSLLALLFHLAPGGFPLFAITHPGDERRAFLNIFPVVTLLAIATIASATRLVLTVRRQPVHAPGWFNLAVTALIAFAIGGLLLGSFAGPSKGAASSAQAGVEVVHLTGNTFNPDIVAVHKGDMLALVDDSPTPHVIANGSWSSDGNKTLPATEPGAPVVNNITVNGNTLKTGPWTTPGTYHLYCSVHPGMNLTVIVQ